VSHCSSPKPLRIAVGPGWRDHDGPVDQSAPAADAIPSQQALRRSPVRLHGDGLSPVRGHRLPGPNWLGRSRHGTPVRSSHTIACTTWRGLRGPPEETVLPWRGHEVSALNRRVRRRGRPGRRWRWRPAGRQRPCSAARSAGGHEITSSGRWWLRRSFVGRARYSARQKGRMGPERLRTRIEMRAVPRLSWRELPAVLAQARVGETEVVAPG
jgi:hypothetical protein